MSRTASEQFSVQPAAPSRPKTPASRIYRGLQRVGLLSAIAVLASTAGCVTTVVHQRSDVDRASAGKLDGALQLAVADGGGQRLRVIVRAGPGNIEALAATIESSGGRVVERFSVIDAMTVEIGSDDLLALATSPVVASVSTDGVVESAQRKGRTKKTTTTTPEEDTTVTVEPDQDEPVAAPLDEGTTVTLGTDDGTWKTESLAENHLLNTLGLAEEPWTGAGVNVAVIDSGTYMAGEFCGQWDFRNGASPSFRQRVAGTDPYGHGTHVVGLISNAGRETGSLYRGVAPGIDCLYSLRVLDDQGAGYTSDVIRAIEWVLTNQKRAQVDIINLSLGHPIHEPAASDPLVQAVEAAVSAGVVVVASAGNYGYDRATGETGYAGITSPGNAPSAIAVGAFDTQLTDSRSDDVVARYSSRGPTWYDAFAKPDILAPGSSLTSTTSASGSILLGNPQLEVEKTSVGGMTYIRLSGTSMAAAVTTGVVAQMIDAHTVSSNWDGTLTPNAIKAIPQYSALPLAETDVLTQGAGGLNGDGAIALAAGVDSTTAEGARWLVAPVNEYSTISGDEFLWSQRLVWGDQIYHNDPAWALRLAWGDRLVWGDLDDGMAGMTSVQ